MITCMVEDRTYLSRIGDVGDRVLIYGRIFAVVLQDKVREGLHEAHLFGFLQPKGDHRDHVVHSERKEDGNRNKLSVIRFYFRNNRKFKRGSSN